MNDLAVREDNHQLADTGQQQTGNAIISVIERAATNPDVDINKMERLLDMQERIMERNAKSAFSAAMAQLQGELPTISEKGEIKVNGQVRSKYARFEDINEAVRPVMQKFGFAISFRVKTGDSHICVTGVLVHREGHSEETTIDLPADITGSKNTVQSVGSSVSYGKRYVLQALLNITTSGEDDDGNAGGAYPNDKAQAEINAHLNYAALVRDHFPTIAAIKSALADEDFSSAAEAMSEISKVEQERLWKAPSKGGIFTTEERKQMKSDEFGAAMREFLDREAE
ncbi:hypothetical protein RE428_32270 [Marinobacter nanhaiticus D15-8W]|uniref:Single-stranded DNA-binding protein n=1 Tax=Marinobacter nanhaiticus D15-8W TaxID=626887 RepID=N6X705_9GAMM|nr:ERF family protein [Marinobacter nanhaiticus]ENO16918.1 single-stranded DNA-binding protein [Marinobacter nanhaiticus D15-8W]BES72209.1 hypothetical protein RE428_32270 [Marinobacter nanhaiticus D15-8W]